MLPEVVFDFFGTLVRYDDAAVRPDDTRAHRYLAERGLALSFEDYRAGMSDVLAAFAAEGGRPRRAPGGGGAPLLWGGPPGPGGGAAPPAWGGGGAPPRREPLLHDISRAFL